MNTRRGHMDEILTIQDSAKVSFPINNASFPRNSKKSVLLLYFFEANILHALAAFTNRTATPTVRANAPLNGSRNRMHKLTQSHVCGNTPLFSRGIISRYHFPVRVLYPYLADISHLQMIPWKNTHIPISQQQA